MRLTPPTHRRSTQGFSIIELMVAVSIIALIIGISFPFISAMTSSGRVEAGLNVSGMAADVARQWVQAESWADDGIANGTNPTGESYSGTAAIYCPTGEIRIVKNDRSARATGGGFLEGPGSNTNGYRDLSQVDYIRIPDGAGVAGIYRDATGVRFIAPPFAIAFNELGQLNYGDNGGLIYYDADRSGDYDLGETRASVTGGYDPSDSSEDKAPISADGLSLELPFEAIECVPGVVVYSQEEFEEQQFSFDGGGSVTLASDEGQWLIENGQTIFFSPHTGVALRDEIQE